MLALLYHLDHLFCMNILSRCRLRKTCVFFGLACSLNHYSLPKRNTCASCTQYCGNRLAWANIKNYTCIFLLEGSISAYWFLCMLWLPKILVSWEFFWCLMLRIVCSALRFPMGNSIPTIFITKFCLFSSSFLDADVRTSVFVLSLYLSYLMLIFVCITFVSI